MINVTIWNENFHEQAEGEHGDLCRACYPNGIHAYLKEALAAPDLTIRAVSLDQPEQGLPEDILNNTDVLLWWGHVRHGVVEDALVDRIQKRVLNGMGLIVLHSAHASKIFKRLMGTSCNLQWREVNERERVWTIAPNHPIAQGVPSSFGIEHTEMYGEPFDIPDDGKVVFGSWYQGGNIFRSGVAFNRGIGKIFYFSPGHETLPIYHNVNVQKIISNAIRWAAPTAMNNIFDESPNEKEPTEPIA